MKKDYNGAQTKPIRLLRNLPDPRDARALSQGAQDVYGDLYGERREERHVCAAGLEPRWLIKGKRLDFVLMHGEDQTLFFVANEPVGWQRHSVIAENLTPGFHGYWFTGPLEPVETFEP